MAQKPLTILTVCTANICRSPVAERLLAAWLPDAVVSSAGTQGLVGHPMDPRSARALEDRQVSTDNFTARQLTKQQVQAADLILTAEVTHRDAALRLLPAALKRTFTLREFAHLAADAEELTDPKAFIRSVASRRGPGFIAPDIADPVSVDAAGYAAVIDQIGEVSAVIGAVLRRYT